MKDLFIIILLAVITFGCSTNQNTEKKQIKEIVENYAANQLLNGAVLIAYKDNIIYKGSFGYANIQMNDINISSTLFPLCSVTKQFTATAIMLLQEKGMLSIDDKISNYMEVPPTLHDIPIKNLMNMTSGIFNYWENNIKNNKDSILKFHYESKELYFPTNTKYHYNNSNYFFLGLIIESVSGQSYNEFLTQNIFAPAGMINTFLYDGNEYKRATGYNENWNVDDRLITTADGGILSTIDDLLQWDIALSENKIITEESKNEMFQPLALNNGKMNHYGFGWNLEENQVSLFSYIFGSEKKIVSHTGGLAGFGAYNQYDTKNDLYIIILSNQRRPELFDLKNDINKALYKDFK